MILTPSNLTATHSDLMLDASVLINILGTGRSDIILKTLNRAVKVDKVAFDEVTVDPFTMKSPAGILSELRKQKLIEVVSLNESAYDIFLELAGAEPPDDLDDGESATLAHASCSNYAAVIDERKATRIAGARFPKVPLLNSLDLLAAPEMFQVHSRETVAEVIYLALRTARMRVRQSERAWIVALLGNGRANECPCLGMSLAPPVRNQVPTL
jgi:predicted nucleic acid-binding protein